MRRASLLFVVGVVVLGLAGIANARPLRWEGSTELVLGDFERVTFTGSGVATVNGSSGSIPAHLSTLRLAASRGDIGGSTTQFVTDPLTIGNQIHSIQFIDVGGGTGTIGSTANPISGAIQSANNLGPSANVLPIRGVVKLCLLSTTCTSFLPLILNQHTTGSGEIGVGIGGLLTIKGGNGIRISIEAAPWTVKQVTVFDHTHTPNSVTGYAAVQLKGFAHGPLSNTTSTAAPSGVFQMVTPTQVVTNLTLGTNNKVSSGVILLIHFIPEPGLLLLLGSGVVGLAVLGRRRMRH